MRMTKFVGLAILLVAMAATINALAFRSAEVTNGFSVVIDSTENAALAIEEAVGVDTGTAVDISSGRADVQILEAVQPDSVYVFGPVFTLTNNSTYPMTLALAHDIPGVTVKFYEAGTTTELTSIGAASAKDVDIEISVPDTYAGALSATAITGELVVTATR